MLTSVKSSKTVISVLVYALTSQEVMPVSVQKAIALAVMEERVKVSITLRLIASGFPLVYSVMKAIQFHTVTKYICGGRRLKTLNLNIILV
jgi:hypothetical protein